MSVCINMHLNNPSSLFAHMKNSDFNVQKGTKFRSGTSRIRTRDPQTLSFKIDGPCRVCRFRLHRTGSIEIVDKEISAVLDTSKDNHCALVKGHNPWSLHCHKEQLSRMWRKSHAATPDSILLHSNS